MRKHKRLSKRSKLRSVKTWISRASVPLTILLLVTGIITLIFAYRFSTNTPQVKGEEVSTKKVSSGSSQDPFSPTTDSGGLPNQSSSDSAPDPNTTTPTPPTTSPTVTPTPQPTPSPSPPPDPTPPSPPPITPSIAISDDGCFVSATGTPGDSITIILDGVSGVGHLIPDSGLLQGIPTGATLGATVNATLQNGLAAGPVVAGTCPAG